MAEAGVADVNSALAPAEMAARYGLRPAGALPSMRAYTRQLWAYRHFIAAFANGQLISSFASARMGRLWQVLTPLTNAGVYYLMFGVVLNTQDGIDNFIAYLCTGIFVFTFTQKAVLAGVRSISDNLGLIRALHFPRASLPIAFTLTELQQMVASIAVLIAIVAMTGERPTMRWLLIVPALVLQSLFNAGLAMATARLGARTSDVRQIIPFMLRTWMYASGVFYSVTTFSAHLPPLAAKILLANPLLIYIQLVRHSLLESAPLASSETQSWLLGLGWAVVVAVGGYLYFWRGEQEYGRG